MRYLVTFSILLVMFFCPTYGRAEEAGTEIKPPDLEKAFLKLATPKIDLRKQFIGELAKTGDPRVVQLLEDYRLGNLYRWEGRLVLALEIYENDDLDEMAKLSDFLTRKPMPKSKDDNAQAEIKVEDLEALAPSPAEYQAMRDAKVTIELYGSDLDKRLQAINRLGDLGKPESTGVLADILKEEKDPLIRSALQENLNVICLNHSESIDKEKVAAAVTWAQETRSGRVLNQLKRIQEENKDEELRAQAQAAIADIEFFQAITRWIGHIYSGISLGSILILMALGLSIIYGQMGVINMAHGELMMIGAYTAYNVQRCFEMWMPESALNWYFVVAFPLSFLCAALVGYLIEALVIRHLYGRPLDTLLATWGVSLVLIQIVRVVYGDNIAVNSPSWLSGGGFEPMGDLVLPYNRCFILVLCLFCIWATYALMGRTKLGLLVRATTQNRDMANGLGVNTRRIDGYTFAFGAGLAGVAGWALTLIGGVTPDMGQTYIVDSFLVVVTGGVGKLAGAISAGMGIGCLNKFFEPFVQAVWGKVLVLMCVVLFIQWRPSGLFPPKGRLADV